MPFPEPAMSQQIDTFLRYPGSKRRMLAFLAAHLPKPDEILGRFIEPFVGGGAIYFFMHPKRALLGDINAELISLYVAIKRNPSSIWRIYRRFPNTKKAYKTTRDCDVERLTGAQQAARLLYLNRTCFKGMWRHNQDGKFNIGYGGQSRRWAIERKHLLHISKLLQTARIVCADFEKLIAQAETTDFLFLDPPYRPGQKEQLHDHYAGRQFTFADHERLASCLRDADDRGVPWVLTISNHPDILRLYRGFRKLRVPKGTGPSIGSLTKESGEVLITNF
ncbi:MAG: DNA adenine methylase [Terriglobales bacterium]